MSDRTDRPDDPLVDQTEQAEADSSVARAFDVRRVIGGLFAVYGVIVTVIGLTDSSAEIGKAQGIRINLWTGLAMLAFGGLMLLWHWLRPAEAPQPPAADSTATDSAADATTADSAADGPSAR